jgi:hypothetical protein
MPDTTQPFNNKESNALYDTVAARLTSQGLASLIPTMVNLITKYGSNMPETLNAELAATDAYKKRFAGNEARKAANLPVLSEAQYLNNEASYHELLHSYGAGDLATSDTYSKLIGGDISVSELNNRFTNAVTKVNNAIASNDTALLDQLKQMYPGIAPQHLATSLLLGNEGADYLKNKFGVAEIKAAETETGMKSNLGAEFLQSQGLTRDQARQGLSAVSIQQTGAMANANIWGDNRSAQDIQTDLEKENLLGQQTKANKELASRARANFAGAAGAQSQSLQRKDVGAV